MTDVGTDDTVVASLRAATRRTASGPWPAVGAVAAIGAGVLHVLAAARRLEHGELVVGFLLLVAAAQAAGGLVLAAQATLRRRPDPRLLLAGLVGTVAVLVLFVVAHTSDLLLGHVSAGAGHGGHAAAATGPFAGGAATRNDTLAGVREAPGLVGMLSVALELVTVAVLAALLPRRWRSRALDGLLALGALGWLLWLTGVLG